MGRHSLTFLLLSSISVISNAQPGLNLDHPTRKTKFTIIFNDQMLFGNFDEEGVFVEDVKVDRVNYVKPGSFNTAYGHMNLRWYNIIDTDTHSVDDTVYELKSGRLILGSFQKSRRQSVFVPKVGSKILPFDSKEPTEFLVYNYEKSYEKYWTASRIFKSEQLRNDKTSPGYPNELEPFRDKHIKFYFRDISSISCIGKVQKNLLTFGEIDSRGDFVRNTRIPEVNIEKGIIQVNDFKCRDRTYPTIYNLPITKKNDFEDVYEYRSGTLIFGKLLSNGMFQPKVNSEIITLEKYQSDVRLSAYRIYNAPGFIEMIKTD
jgi:hypothetical protein